MNVTLATLPRATAQDVYDHIARRMRAQGFVQSRIGSASSFMFAYRDTNGRAAPAGHCMTEDEYRALNQRADHLVDESIEGTAWMDLVRHHLVPTAHAYLLSDLQAAHDRAGDPEAMLERLKAVAYAHHLSPSALTDGINQSHAGLSAHAVRR